MNHSRIVRKVVNVKSRTNRNFKEIIRHLAPLLVSRSRRPTDETMGALHPGHMALVEAANAQCGAVVASIFVNPTQFGEGEDLDAYPRQEAADAALLEAAGVRILWAPAADEVYPQGYATSVSVSGISQGLCGGSRPGHFDGVATVVAKLFNQIRPDAAFFGEKDFQQLAVIRRMARDLDFEHAIVGIPTVRDSDGLALSSRNAYLDAEQRAQAVALPTSMRAAAAAIASGGDIEAILTDAQAELRAAGFHKVDYFELRNADTLEVMNVFKDPARLLAAAHIGSTRLIDNM